jgi:hypothetical protein
MTQSKDMKLIVKRLPSVVGGREYLTLHLECGHTKTVSSRISLSGDIFVECTECSREGNSMKPDSDESNELRKVLAAKMQRIRDAQPTDADIKALKTDIEFLLDIAERGTGQSARVTNFLLAWWNAAECGGFDFTDLWAVDLEIVETMWRVFQIISTFQHYPDSPKLGYGKRFEKLAKARNAARVEAKQ